MYLLYRLYSVLLMFPKKLLVLDIDLDEFQFHLERNESMDFDDYFLQYQDDRTFSRRDNNWFNFCIKMSKRNGLFTFEM